MPLYTWLLTALLVSQTGGNLSAPVTVAPPTTNSIGPAVSAASSAGTAAAGGTSAQKSALPAAAGRSTLAGHDAPARAVQPPAGFGKATTAQLVADALALPPGSTISGRRVSLLSVVATAPQRQGQIEAVHAYWKLAEAVGDYHFAHDRQQRLARLQAVSAEAAELRTAQAIAAADLSEAQLQLTTAQHDLSEVLLLAPGTPLPLPADLPLVGAYRTLFAELFAGQQAPQRAAMLDQALPLRNKAVEAHAAALVAAEDALDAAIELQSGGQGRLAGVVAALDALVRQQRAFLAAVCRYNHDIADYALAVVSPRTSPEILVGTLIKQNRPAGQAATPLPTMATLPTAYQQPVNGAVAPPGMPNQPTRAVWPGAMPAQSPESPSVVPAGNVAPIDAPASVAPPDSAPNDDAQAPRLAPPQETAIPLVPEKAAPSQSPAGSMNPGQGNSRNGAATDPANHPTPHTSQKPIDASGPPQASAVETYPGLAGLAPLERSANLAAVLYWQRNLPSVQRPGTQSSRQQPANSPASIGRPPSAAQPMRLIDCLRTMPAGSRLQAIESYWAVRQTAARYQILVEQTEWLEALGPALSAQDPPSPTAILDVRTARLAVEAQQADAEAEWTVARLELAALAGLRSDQTLPQPVSVPFVGLLPLHVSRAGRSWSQQRLEATIPQRQQAIVEQASAVVLSDVSRAAATADFLAARSSVERVLAGIEVQALATSAFLRAVGEYNRAISQYAVATLPASIPAEKLVAALMVE